jgi:hypothetical protein
MERYRAPIFWLVVAAAFSAFIGARGLADPVAGSRGRGLAVVQQFLHWLLVEPLGLLGAIGLVMGLGAVAAALTWPRY